ncbi:anaphase-promoting complex subunit 10 [Arachis duranensis]|uniref:Anaphase-promoting complex subunit 10 n=1 Tax=Arachis duranensis TaxID=130453 RepID=A0A6P5MMW7_ARADU|nr:anaphase-promoting complex subunit 10 [Arachis duranensis]
MGGNVAAVACLRDYAFFRDTRCGSAGTRVLVVGGGRLAGGQCNNVDGTSSEIKTVELVKPTGWVYLSLSGTDPRETFVNTFMLQIAVLSNHLNGRDTHVRQIKVYGPRPNPISHQPFQFTSSEFITYSSIR